MKQLQKKQEKRDKKDKQRKQQGGVGAADHALAIYGDTVTQHSEPGNGNVIAMNKSFGGKRKTSKKEKKGGMTLVDMAVPAILLGANLSYRKKNKGSSKKRSSRRTRRNR